MKNKPPKVPNIARDIAHSIATGQVSLVGAGPGDPDLLTLKAVKTIAAATVILVDDLVNEAVLQHANANARIVYVGKRGGCASTPQAFIEKLMISEAQKGENVVRLKGGDPLVFGRSGEEIEALQKAGIRVHIVNGITAALGALASLNTAMTHREGVVHFAHSDMSGISIFEEAYIRGLRAADAVFQQLQTTA